ncbi:MAG: ABC transporter permease [Pedococcus sp.]
MPPLTQNVLTPDIDKGIVDRMQSLPINPAAVLVGSAMRSVEAVNGLMFAMMLPITFLADTFAPTERMTPWLRTIAEWNPISSLVLAVRELWNNVGPFNRRTQQ